MAFINKQTKELHLCLLFVIVILIFFLMKWVAAELRAVAVAAAVAETAVKAAVALSEIQGFRVGSGINVELDLRGGIIILCSIAKRTDFEKDLGGGDGGIVVDDNTLKVFVADAFGIHKLHLLLLEVTQLLLFITKGTSRLPFIEASTELRIMAVFSDHVEDEPDHDGKEE